MTLPVAVDAGRDSAPPPRALGAVTPSRWWGVAVFLAATAVYTAVGIVLAMRFNLVDGDGPSRVANAGYVTLSRDPHLGAIGFVWNPLPSLVNIPILELSRWWAPLKTHGQAGTIQAALFMAAAVLGVRRIAYDRAVPGWCRIVIVTGFALNPMIVQYGGNGMSEAALIACLLWGLRYLMLWMNSAHGPDLAFAGIWIGVAYLARYEALAATAGAVVVVAGRTWLRSRAHDRRRRLSAGFHDAVIVAAPSTVAVAVWALSSWLLTGHLFAQFSSQYGNSAQLSVAVRAGTLSVGTTSTTLLQIANSILGLQPLLIVVVLLAATLGFLRRDPTVLAPVAVLGGVVCFAALAHLTGITFGWLRFYIAAVPLGATLAATLWTPIRSTATPGSGRLTGAAVAAVAILASATAIPVTWQTMLDPAMRTNAIQQGLRSLVFPSQEPRDQNPLFVFFQDDRQIATFLDSLDLAPATVLTDTREGWAIWLASGDSAQFVITSDKDFDVALNAPRQFGIEYILVSNPELDAGQDAVNRRYPTMWDDGAQLGTLALRVVGPDGLERWRIYRIIR